MIDNKTIRKVIMLNKMLPSGSPTYVDREASGAVANFTTNVVKPFVKCECTIDATESGTSVLNVEQAGKNLFDKTAYAFTTGKWINILSGNPNNDNAYACTLDYIPIRYLAGQTITLNHTPGGTNPGMAFYKDDKSFISGGKGSNISVPANAYFMRFTVDNTYSSGEDIQVELGNTATDYAPYSGTTTTVTLEETAYGGRIDVISGLGQIIDEHGETAYVNIEPVDISSIEGVNNVWCDTGNIKVTYKYKTGEGGSSTKKYLPIFYDFYGKEKYKHDHS